MTSRKSLFLVTVLFYYFSCVAAYHFGMSPRSEAFPSLAEAGALKVVGMGLLVAFISLVLPPRGVCGFAALVGLLLIIIPGAVLFLGNIDEYGRSFAVSLLGFATFLIATTVRIPFSIPINFVSSEGSFRKVFWFFVVPFACVVLFAGWKEGPSFSFESSHVARESRAALPVYWHLACGLLGKVLLPLLIVLFVSRRRFREQLFCLVVAFFLFAVTGYKSYFFFTLIAGVLAWFIGFLSFIGIPFVLGSFISLSTALLALTGAWAEGTVSFFWFFVRRVFFVPAQLNLEYIKFFSGNPKVYWANSRITFGLIESPFDSSIPKVVGNYLFGGETVSSAGFIGFGYAQAGLIGVVLYSILFGILIKLADALTSSSKYCVCFLFPFLTIAWTNSDLLTCLLSHFGILTLVLAVFLFPAAADRKDVL